ncbi:MAG TPA: class II glutamine amidotransferase [Streptosporangiaceae bacterium]
MCRLLGWSTQKPATLLDLIGEESLSRFTGLASLHSHGWGIAWREGGQSVCYLKETGAADQSPMFLEIARTLRATAAILHLRHASPGLAVTSTNTHPFIADGMGFAHNGYIPSSARLLNLLTDRERARLQGETDSERYFAVLRNHTFGKLWATNIQTGIAEVTRTADPISLNALLLTTDNLFGIVWHYRPGEPGGEAVEGYKTPDFYDMGYMYAREGFVVASGGWQDEGWTQLPNRSGLSLNSGKPEDFFTFDLPDNALSL